MEAKTTQFKKVSEAQAAVTHKNPWESWNVEILKPFDRKTRTFTMSYGGKDNTENSTKKTLSLLRLFISVNTSLGRPQEWLLMWIFLLHRGKEHEKHFLWLCVRDWRDGSSVGQQSRGDTDEERREISVKKRANLFHGKALKRGKWKDFR